MRSETRGNLFMLLLVIYQITCFVVLGQIMEFLPPFDEIGNLVYAGMTGVVVFFPPVVVYLAIRKQKITDILPFKKISIKNMLFIVAVVIAAQPVAMALSGLATIFFPNDAGEMVNSFNSFSYPLTVLVVCVLPAIFEELPLRGVIQSEYKGSSVILAALVNGLFFGIIHLNFQQFFYAFFLGMVLFYLVHITGSIWSSILTHFLFNFAQVSLSAFILSLDLSEHQALTDEAALSPAAYAAVFLAMFAIFLPVLMLILWAQTRYNKRLKEKNAASNDAQNRLGSSESTLNEQETSVAYEVPKKQRGSRASMVISFFAVVFVYLCIMTMMTLAEKGL